MTIKQISVFIENTPGSLQAMTGVLAEHSIDMRALSLAETEDFGIARIIVDDIFTASTVLKDAGYVHSLTPVVGVSIPDTPGGLNKVLAVFTEEKINVDYMYAFMGGRSASHAYMIFRVNDPAAAAAALTTRGIKLVQQDDMTNL